MSRRNKGSASDLILGCVFGCVTWPVHLLAKVLGIAVAATGKLVVVSLALAVVGALLTEGSKNAGLALALFMVLALLVWCRWKASKGTDHREPDGPGLRPGNEFPYVFGIYPENWAEIKRRVLARDGHRCQNCGGRTELHVHHIVPINKGGTSDPNNLVTICRACHTMIHPHMRTWNPRPLT